MRKEESVASRYLGAEKRLNGLLFILMFLFSFLLLIPDVRAQENHTMGRGHGYITEHRARERATMIVMPDYPEEVIQHKIAGVMKAKIEITSEGDVIRATVQPGLHPLLQEAVFKAVKQWKFKPTARSYAFPDSTWISRLTFNYIIDYTGARVEMYTPPPDAKPFDQLGGMFPRTEMKEWQEWRAAYPQH
jgi:TonB family protein